MTRYILIALLLIAGYSCMNPEHRIQGKDFVYQGEPYSDSVRASGSFMIPGRIECEFYDTGGESVAYHDSDTANNGSGNLNQGEGYLNNFRTEEGPDISFTKFYDSIDNSRYNLVQPMKEQLYLGWTEPGEWTNYTVNVETSGSYRVGVMYTSNRGGSIRIITDGADSTGLLAIESTFDPEDPLDWRQWHHWNYDDSLTTLTLKKGKRVLTLLIAEEGNFNFDFLEFSRAN